MFDLLNSMMLFGIIVMIIAERVKRIIDVFFSGIAISSSPITQTLSGSLCVYPLKNTSNIIYIRRVLLMFALFTYLVVLILWYILFVT